MSQQSPAFHAEDTIAPLGVPGLEICELVPAETNLNAGAQLTVFNPSELELGETTEALIAAVEKFKPKRIVVDSLSELRLVAQSSLRYRRQILALKQFFGGRNCTVLLLDDESGERGDSQLESIAHGVIRLEQLANQFGAERRRVRVIKLRGVPFRGGHHDFSIRSGEHERTIRELTVNGNGLRIGPALSEFQGVLTGVPTFVGRAADLQNRGDRGR